MQTIDDPLARGARLSAITASYARFSRSFGGYGTALGGALGLVMAVCMASGPTPSWARPWFFAAPFGWVVAKEVFRRRYYQRHGVVIEKKRREMRPFGFVMAAAAAAAFWTTAVIVINRETGFDAAKGAWLCAVLAAPIVMFFGLTSTIDWLLGFYLFLPVVTRGRLFPLSAGGDPSSLSTLAFFSACAMVYGLFEHREFRRIEVDMRTLREGGLPIARPVETAPSEITAGLATAAAASASFVVVLAAMLWQGLSAAALAISVFAFLAVRYAVHLCFPRASPDHTLPRERAFVLSAVIGCFWIFCGVRMGEVQAVPLSAWLAALTAAAVFAWLGVKKALTFFEVAYLGWIAIEASMAFGGLPPRRFVAGFAAAFLVVAGLGEYFKGRRRTQLQDTPAA